MFTFRMVLFSFKILNKENEIITIEVLKIIADRKRKE